MRRRRICAGSMGSARRRFTPGDQNAHAGLKFVVRPCQREILEAVYATDAAGGRPVLLSMGARAAFRAARSDDGEPVRRSGQQHHRGRLSPGAVCRPAAQRHYHSQSWRDVPLVSRRQRRDPAPQGERAAGWVAENAALRASDPQFDQATLAPKHAGMIAEWSRNTCSRWPSVVILAGRASASGCRTRVAGA